MAHHKIRIYHLCKSIDDDQQRLCFVAIGGTYKEPKFEPGDTFAMVKISLSELLAKIDDSKNVFQSLHLAAIFFALNFLKRQGKL